MLDLPFFVLSLYSSSLTMSRTSKRQSADPDGEKQNGLPPARRAAYPFTAIVGQEEMKLALVLSVIDPHIGGVIIMGHRGTGKSTAVRALVDLLPPIKKVSGCFYGCDPEALNTLCNDCLACLRQGRKLAAEKRAVCVVDLPLGATEDRVCGALDIERALIEGSKAFEPGLLAKANRGFLYIDEVNLLEDHLVDILLDVAASGRNTVEREGISVNHPAQFVLVGSGNPEEGELRPQLLDRFGLFTQVRTIMDVEQRIEIMLRRERFERDPEGLRAEWQPQQVRLQKQIVRAKRVHSRVKLREGQLRLIASLGVALEIDGHRGELTVARAARALAAFEGRTTVADEDICQVAMMSLRHRLRKDPLERMESGARVEQAVRSIFPMPFSSTQEQQKPLLGRR